MRRRAFLGGIAASGLSVTIAGCSGTPSDSGPQTEPPTTTSGDEPNTDTTPEPSTEISDPVTYGVGSPVAPASLFGFHPVLANQLSDDGVTLAGQSFNGFTATRAGLLREEAHFALAPMATLVNAVNQGYPLTGFAENSQQFDFGLVVASEIEGWDDLQGGTVAVHGENSMTRVVGQTIVEEELGSIDAVDWEYIVGTPNRLSALRSGNIDATVGLTAGLVSAEQAGFARLLAHATDYDSLSDQTTSVWVMLNQHAADPPNRAVALSDRIGEAWNAIYDWDPEELAAGGMAQSDYLSAFSQSVYEQVINLGFDNRYWGEDAMMTRDKIERSLDTLVAGEIIDESQRIAPEDFTDSRFLA